jgi:hypothetical protein
MVNMLTIQIFKDDWTRASGFGVLGSPAFSTNFGQHQQHGPSPILDSGSLGLKSHIEGHGHGDGHSHGHGVTSSSDFKTSTPLKGTHFLPGMS